MRVREKRYADYGLTDERVRELLAFCRNPDNFGMVREAVVAANPPLADAIADSLIQRYGYDAQMRWNYIPATKADFYAYRRKALAIFDRLLVEEGGASNGQLPQRRA